MFVFISAEASVGLVNRCFGGVESNEQCIPITSGFTKADMAVATGKFKSKTQARKNGWDGEIPGGIHQWKIGKTTFWSYIPFDHSHWEDFSEEERRNFFTP